MKHHNLLGSLNGDKIKSTAESLGWAAIALAISFAAAISFPILPVVSITNIRETPPLIPNRLSTSVSSRIARSCLNTFTCLFGFFFLQWRGKSDSWHRPWVLGQWHSGGIYFDEEIKNIFLNCLSSHWSWISLWHFQSSCVRRLLRQFARKTGFSFFFTLRERQKSHKL